MIPIDEAEKIHGFPSRATLRRWCELREITCEQVYKGSRLSWRVNVESIRAKLNGSTGDYESLLNQWIADQTSGYHRGRAMGAKSIQANTYGVEKFWEYLRYTPKEDRPEDYKIHIGGVSELTPDNLRVALSNVPVDYKAKNCHFSIREQMWKGISSFSEILVRQGLKSQSDLVEFKKLKPKRIFPPKKTVLTEDGLITLLNTNLGRKYGRQDIDVQMTHTVLLLAAMAGLRRAEIINLHLDHVRLKDRELDVIDGKGHKDRTVGLVPQLYRQLKAWLTMRPQSDEPFFIVTKTGNQLDSRGFNRRVQRMADQTGVKITPHGLRRTFATVNIEKGMPVPIAQKLLGHADLSTTMQYCMIDEKTAIDFLKRPKVGTPRKKSTPPRAR